MKYLVLAVVLAMSVGIMFSVASQAYAISLVNSAGFGIAHNAGAASNVQSNTEDNPAGDVIKIGPCPTC
jgi:hypothetical protein